MIPRPFWTERLRAAWKQAPIAWLSGVRRCGKTTLARGLGEDQIHYVNCDLPVVEEMVRDPVLFYRGHADRVIVFDEIHQLRDPSRVLKIGADMFPGLRILATGSSTLAASRKFRDALTGRKRMIHLLPVLLDELDAFGGIPLEKRLLRGGLPPMLLAASKDPAPYREWMDSFFARDIQKLFGFRDAAKFDSLFQYLLRQSGGLFEVSKTASALGISRPTVEAHLRALEITHAVTVLRPFHGGSRKELVRMPKVYAFDTGFVSFARGWDPLRPEDCGALWEHVVLEYLQAHQPDATIRYWRDLGGRELDLVNPGPRGHVDVFECKWNPDQFDETALRTFRALHPHGRNFLISPISVHAFDRSFRGLEVHVCTPAGWLEASRRAAKRSSRAATTG